MPNRNDINQHPKSYNNSLVGLLSKLMGGRDSSLENAASIAQLVGAGRQASNMAGQTLIKYLLNDLYNKQAMTQSQGTGSLEAHRGLAHDNIDTILMENQVGAADMRNLGAIIEGMMESRVGAADMRNQRGGATVDVDPDYILPIEDMAPEPMGRASGDIWNLLNRELEGR